MRRIAITGIVIAAMTFAACGGSSKPSASTGTTAKSGSGSNTTAPSGNDALSKLAAQYTKAKIKITYTSNDGTSFTLAQNGSGKNAFTSDNSTFYTDGKSSISCDGTGPTATCTDLGSLGAAAGGIGASLTAVFAAFANALSTISGGTRSTETIAGREASCVKYRAGDIVGKLSGLSIFKGADLKSSDYDPNDTATICIDKQSGFLLKFASTKKGAPSDSLTATAVSEPSDSDFTPPVTPQTMPSLPGGITVPTVPGG